MRNTEMPAMTQEIGSPYRRNVSQLSPRSIPAHVSANVHGRHPRNVYRVNFPNGILATPAGSEMNVRTTGRSRETNTAASPWRSNHSWARSSSCSRRKTYRPHRSISGRPPRMPTQ
jgi:hypothetical protein